MHGAISARCPAIASGMPCTAGGFTQRALATLPGTKKNKHVVSPRIVMGMRVHLKLAVMFAFDGATTIAASGNSFAEGDLFSRTPKEMMNIFLHAVPIAKGETLADVARRLVPPSMLTACGTLSRRDAKWVSEYVAYVNRHSANADLQAVTAEPERQPQAAQAASIGQAGRKGKDAALFGKGASDGRTAPKLMPFVDPRVTRFRYVSSTFIPTIDGNLPNAWNTPATRDGMVRMPIFPTHFDKPLVKAVWDWSKHADITCRLALCIIHCGMRTMESCLKGVLGILREKYEAGKGDHQALIDHHLNRVLSSTTTGLGLRRLISTDKTGALNDVTLNGGEVRALIADLQKLATGGESIFVNAVTTALKHVAPELNDDTTHMSEWRNVLKHWGCAMGAAYQQNATEAHKQTFREHVKFYVMSKACISADGLCWYDWQLYSVMTVLFDRYESLMMISQEGMEAVQKQNNALQRNSNNGSNSGRYPMAVIARGIQAIKAYLAERRRKLISPAQWLWRQQALLFYASHSDVMTLAEELKVSGNVKDWATELVPDKQVSIVAGLIGIKLRKWARRGLAQKAGSQFYTRMLQQHELYYAPLPCETEGRFWAMRPEDQAKVLNKGRRERWAALGKAGRHYCVQRGYKYGAPVV